MVKCGNSRKGAYPPLWQTCNVLCPWALFHWGFHLPISRIVTLYRSLPKKRPRHVYSNSKPLKQIIAHEITYNGITSGFEVESWQHTTLWTAQCDGEHSVARGAHRISYVLLCKYFVLISVKYYMKFLTWDTCSAQGRASQTPCEARSRVGVHSSKVWPYTRIGPKVGGGRSFVSGPFFTRLRYKRVG